jgi:ComF family protein
MVKKFLLDLFFPKFCFGCQKEGSYLCPDCLSVLEISSIHQKYSTKNLADLYFALPYQNPLVKKLIQKFKYKPFIKELAENLAFLIITHLQLLDNKPNFTNFILIPIPLNEKRLKWRGFNQAEEISKELSKFLKLPLVSDCLLRVKNSYPQVELTAEARKENVKNIFSCQNKKEIFGKKILLVDDVYTTGATMEEAARVLKESGAKEVLGIVVARANPGQDKLEDV